MAMMSAIMVVLFKLMVVHLIEQDFDCADVVSVQKNTTFAEEFFFNIKSIYNRLVGTKGEFNELMYRQHFMGCCALYVFYTRLYNPKLGISQHLLSKQLSYTF